MAFGCGFSKRKKKRGMIVVDYPNSNILIIEFYYSPKHVKKWSGKLNQKLL